MSRVHIISSPFPALPPPFAYKVLILVSTVKIKNIKKYLGTQDMAHLEPLSILALFQPYHLHLPT